MKSPACTLPVVTAVLALTANAQSEPASLPVPDLVALGVVMSLPAVFVLRPRLTLHEFEAGLATVSLFRRRVTVVRWADLAAVREDIGQDQEGDWHFYGYLLEDHAGSTVDIGKRARELKARTLGRCPDPGRREMVCEVQCHGARYQASAPGRR